MRSTAGIDTILNLCEKLPDMTFSPGEVLLPEGGRTGFLYVLISGRVEILKGDFQVDTDSQPGAVFGEISVLLDMPHMATVRALTPTRVYRIERASSFLNSHPEIALELACLLARRLNGVTNYLVDLKRHFGGFTGALIGMGIEDQNSR